MEEVMANLRGCVIGAVRTISALGAGFLAGVLAVFVSLHSLGAFRADARPITIRPVIDLRTPTWTPRPTATPTPVPTFTPEEEQEERETWREILEQPPVFEAQLTAARGRGREIFLKLQPEYGERPTVMCPDCYRVEWYTITMGGPSEDPWIIMTLISNWKKTRQQRRLHGIQESDPFDGLRADRG